MIELEVYAAALHDLSKILELDHQLEVIPGMRYKVDSNHNIRPKTKTQLLNV